MAGHGYAHARTYTHFGLGLKFNPYTHKTSLISENNQKIKSLQREMLMPESYKLVRYVGMTLGLVFLSFAVVFRFYSVNSVAESSAGFFAVLAFPSLVCGLVFVFGGLVGIWMNYLGSRKSRLVARARIQDELLGKTKEIQKDTNAIRQSGTYLTYPSKKSVISKIENLQKEIATYAVRKALEADFVDKNKIKEILNECNVLILNYNQNFVQQRKKDYSDLWSKDSILLDDEQLTAIITDDKYNLVVAAAGSGKTEGAHNPNRLFD